MGQKHSRIKPQIADNLFSRLDGETIQRIIKVPSPDAMVLRQVSKFFYSLFTASPEILKHINTKPHLFRKLLGHVALGELADAEKIWRAHPDLLICYGTIFHPSRTYVEGRAPKDVPFHYNPGRYRYTSRTPLQILWMNDEFEDARLIEDLVGPEEMVRQFFEVFPDGVIKKDKFDLEKAKVLLQAVFDAIIKDSSINSQHLEVMNEETRQALDALYIYAKPTSEHKTGLVFDISFYFAALRLYDTKADPDFNECWDEFGRDFIPGSECKHNFWYVRVEEWLAGCLGTGYLRPHAQGLGNKESRLKGCSSSRDNSGSIFSFRGCGHTFYGLNYAVEYFGGYGKDARGRPEYDRLRELRRAKINAASDLCERVTQALKQNRIT